MSDMSPEEVKYQEEYAAALAQLDAAESGKQPETITEPAKQEPEAQEPAKVDPEVQKAAESAAEPTETIAEMRARLEKAEKALKDTQAWGTKNAQQLAELRRAQEEQQRAAARPSILDEQPELAEAIKYVAQDPEPQRKAERAHQGWMQTIEAVHPGIFAADADKELVDALVAKRDADPDSWNDPLVAIRDITAEKLAFNERQTAKRLAAEYATKAAKSAMSVPAAGGGVARAPVDPELEKANRIKSMSDADFEAERRRVMGY